MANTYLTRAIGTTGNRKTFTYSTWLKRGNMGSYQPFMGDVTDPSNDYFTVSFQSADHLNIYSQLAGPGVINISTNKLFRDTSAWYHIVLEVDTTQATASDRLKLYVNGSQETSFSTATYPNQNTDLAINISGETQVVGAGHTLSSNTFDGSMSHAHFIDGTAYDATAFGEYDANGVWKIKTSPSVTYGTNGYFILKDGNSVTDQSGNSNNFTVAGGTLTKTEDSPSNVFATLNPLAIPTSGGANTFSNGNLEITNSADANRTSFSTLGVSSGKWYYECKVLSGEMKQFIGISKPQDSVDRIGNSANSYGYSTETARKYNNGSFSSYGTTASSGDIIMVAFDSDNGTIWVGKNGTWFNSATQSEIENGTTTNAMYSSITIDDFFVMGVSVEDSNIQCNFGNGYFGTTAVSSAGTNASGNGIFEYDVPTGYTALSTKGLNL